MGTTALLATWLGTNAVAVAGFHARARSHRRHLVAQHTIAAGRAMRARARAASHEHGHVPLRTPRAYARAALPFPIDNMQREWRMADERRAARYDEKLHGVVAMLLAIDSDPLPCSCNGMAKYRHARCTACPPHARPGQPMGAPYDWAAEPTSMGVHP